MGMDLTPEKAAKIQADADRLSEQVPPDQRERFAADYVAVMSELNGRIDDRMELLWDDLVPLSGVLRPNHPGLNLAVVTVQVTHAREIVDQLLENVTELDHAAVRKYVCAALRDVLVHVESACLEAEQRNLARTGDGLPD